MFVNQSPLLSKILACLARAQSAGQSLTSLPTEWRDDAERWLHEVAVNREALNEHTHRVRLEHLSRPTAQAISEEEMNAILTRGTCSSLTDSRLVSLLLDPARLTCLHLAVVERYSVEGQMALNESIDGYLNQHGLLRPDPAVMLAALGLGTEGLTPASVDVGVSLSWESEPCLHNAAGGCDHIRSSDSVWHLRRPAEERIALPDKVARACYGKTGVKVMIRLHAFPKPDSELLEPQLEVYPSPNTNPLTIRVAFREGQTRLLTVDVGETWSAEAEPLSTAVFCPQGADIDILREQDQEGSWRAVRFEKLISVCGGHRRLIFPDMSRYRHTSGGAPVGPVVSSGWH